ncbi:MAG: PD-(D/E)XK nuclease family transposase, partial [Cytophagales bacterium]
FSRSRNKLWRKGEESGNEHNQKVASYVKMLDLETYESFSDKLNFVTIEMPKFNKEEHELETNLDKCLYLINAFA